nr:MAG TPA: hypothetical protein [Caudoviricetes sp.]
MFIVLCFPLGNFLQLGLSYFCQPDGFLVTVVCSTELFSDFGKYFLCLSLENFLSSTCTY